MASCEYYVVDSLERLLERYDQAGPEACIIAGGTDLVVNMHKKLVEPELLIDITRVEGLSKIEERDEYIAIGSCCSHSQVVNSELIQRELPFVAESSNWVGAAQTRSLGTIGGNLCSAVPSADSAPPLVAAGAELVLSSVEGERVVKAGEFFTGPRKTVLKANEILTEIRVPRKENRLGKFMKFGRRKALTLAVVNLSIVLSFDRDLKKIEEAGIALGAVAPTPVRAEEGEGLLRGQALEEGLINEVVERIPAAASPITDLRASAEYRIELIKALSRKALNYIREEAERWDS